MSTSPRFKARVTGVFYLLTLLTGIFAQGFVSGRLVVYGDAAGTATNILSHKSLFQSGFTVYLVEMVCNVAMTALFYELLEPVSRSISLLAAFVGLAGCAIKTFGRVFYIAPLFLLDGGRYSSAFGPEQRHALGLLFLEINEQGAGVALAFFGFYTILKGYLIFRSTFLPRVLGVLSAIAGLGWLTFLSPSLGNRVFSYLAPFAFLAAAATVVWLLVFGVNEERWKDQARATRLVA